MRLGSGKEAQEDPNWAERHPRPLSSAYEIKLGAAPQTCQEVFNTTRLDGNDNPTMVNKPLNIGSHIYRHVLQVSAAMPIHGYRACLTVRL